MLTRRYFALLFLALGCVFAQDETPTNQHLIRSTGSLTEPSPRPASQIAREFTAQNFIGVDQSSLYTAKEYTDTHNGVTHIVYRQQFESIEVLNAAWTVNIDRDGRILNAGGSLFVSPTGGVPSALNSLSAARAAAKAVNPRLAARFEPFASDRNPSAPASARGAVRYAAGPFGDDMEGRPVWFGVRGQLQFAWLFQVTDEDGAHIYDVVVDDATSLILDKRAASFFQTAKGLVFERESPNPNPKPGTLVTEPPPLADRTVQPFTGDATASPRGWVQNNQTAGNNAIVGQNALGTTFLLTPEITTAANGDFSFPLPLGPGNLPTTNYRDAINTNLFYWVNRAHDLFYASGFTEAAGNFQQDNLGRGGNGGDPLYAYTHFGSQAVNRAATINAFFTTKGRADGSQSMIAMYIGHTGSGGFYTDGALDSNVIIHEYSHGVSSRLLPNAYDTFQVAAMGEAWSDYFGFDFTLPENAPADGAYVSGEYFDWTWGNGDFRSRPYSTDMKINNLTYQDIGRVIPFPEVHADGEIWMMALWEMRANLIKQFGDKEGRRRARLLILDGMKFMPPGSTMVDARDAILLADRAGFSGASQTQIWTAFAKRGLGATAWSTSGNSVHVHPSFAMPADQGNLEFYESQITIGEPLRIVVADANNNAAAATVQVISSTGDLETFTLKRYGSVYAGTLATSSNVVIRENGTLNIIPGDVASAFYNDDDAGGKAFAQVSAALPVSPAYALSLTAPAFDTTGTETPVLDGERVELPFAFPFFDKKYRSVVVSENGLLSFADTAVTSCTDVPGLRAIPAIAPFWMQLTTRGFAQPREGIFYRQITPTGVRFRWAAETFTPFPSGSPVNFSVVLQDDGVIQFSYGSGNTNLQTAFTVAGCSGGVSAVYPTVGISPGHDTYAINPQFAQTWTNAPTLRFDPPFNNSSDPKVIVEAPARDAKVQDVMTVSGIAYDDDTFFGRAYILVDGRQLGSAGQTVARPDFCARQAVRGCPLVGFSTNISTAGLTPGTHTLQVRAVNARGSITNGEPVSFTVEAGQGRLPFGKIEAPAAGAEVSGTITIRGYAGIADLRVAGIDTLIDGVTFGPTTYGLARADVCSALDTRPLNCPNIGFQVNINTRSGTPPLQDGAHTLQIRVRDETGRLLILPDSVTFTVKNGAFQPSQGAVTSVKSGDVLKGTVTISGYAYAPGSAVRGVFLLWDGGDIFEQARYGVAAPDACAGLPDVTACPNIGWTVEFDTNRLSNGPHVLLVAIVNNRGDITYLPSPGQRAVAVTVQN
jgi:hypothetical protein